jgi:hypothetical protein
MVAPGERMSTEGERLQVSVLPYRCSICPPFVNPHKKFSHTLDSLGRLVLLSAHRQPLRCNFMYHSQILSVAGSVCYMVRNLRCAVTIDSVLANSKTQNGFLSPIHAIFRHDCPLAMKPASTPQRLSPRQTWTDSVPTDMLLSVVWSWLLRSRVRKFRRNL